MSDIMPVLLLCNISGERLTAVNITASRMGLTVKELTADEFGSIIGFSAGLEGFSNEKQDAQESFDEEMLVMCGLSGSEMNALLDALRQQSINIPLKAVLTETNAKWSPARLYKELSAERDMFKAMAAKKAAGKSLHNK